MNNKTFGIVVGIIIALALAMFAGLYMLGMAGNNPNTFNEGYEYNYDDSAYTFDETYDDYANDYTDEFTDFHPEDEFYFEDTGEFSADDNVYYDEEGNAYNFDEIDFTDFEDFE